MTNLDTSSGNDLSRLLSVKEVARTLGISSSGVYRLIDAGELRRIKVGSRTLFDQAEVQRYIAAQRAVSRPQATNDGKPKPAVVLLSGGLDSATVLALAKNEGYRLYALSFRYGQRHAVELDAARKVAAALGVEQHVEAEIDLRVFGGSALTADIEVPKGDSADAIGSDVPITYVPARNTVFLSFALAWAEVLDAGDVFIGVNALDYSGYPDCRPEYIAAYERLAALATKRGIEGNPTRIHTPLIDLTKGQIIRRGLDLGVDYSLTRSCYDPTDAGESCGHCDSCLLRLKGFAEVGHADPVPYRTEVAA
jgi:7-cyano-7-deazaguanine synthase